MALTHGVYTVFLAALTMKTVNYWPPNRTDEGSSPGVSFSFFFFFFFFNIHTSDKLEIFFDHSILVNGVDPWGVHRFLGGINHENGKLLASESDGRGFESRRQLFFFFFFFFFSIFILQIS